MFAKVTTAAAAAIVLLAGTAFAKVPESEDPIIVTIQDWTGEYITAHLIGGVLERMGYNVKYQQADYIAQFAGLESGDLDIAPEMWETTGKQAMDASLKTGKTVDLGETGMKAKEEWWYPIYMKKRCPGLPDWKALLSEKCAKAFSTPETYPKGRYLGGPVTWAGFDDERVEALGLPFEVVHAGTDAALFAELKSAYERKAPFLGWIYAPHWAPIKYKGEWVKFPEYTDACYNDPKWGINPNMKYDCGKPHGWIKKVGWKAGEQKWPCAYKAVRAVHIENPEMGAMIVKVDLDGKSVDDVVSAWFKNNEATWKKWGACAGL